jgi:hypothetical protein
MRPATVRLRKYAKDVPKFFRGNVYRINDDTGFIELWDHTGMAWVVLPIHVLPTLRHMERVFGATTVVRYSDTWAMPRVPSHEEVEEQQEVDPVVDTARESW